MQDLLLRYTRCVTHTHAHPAARPCPTSSRATRPAQPDNRCEPTPSHMEPGPGFESRDAPTSLSGVQNRSAPRAFERQPKLVLHRGFCMENLSWIPGFPGFFVHHILFQAHIQYSVLDRHQDRREDGRSERQRPQRSCLPRSPARLKTATPCTIDLVLTNQPRRVRSHVPAASRPRPPHNMSQRPTPDIGSAATPP
jgi:hypothetical protein